MDGGRSVAKVARDLVKGSRVRSLLWPTILWVVGSKMCLAETEVMVSLLFLCVTARKH